MFSETTSPSQESALRGLRSFIGMIEVGLIEKEKYAPEQARYKEYFGSLSGVIVTSMEPPDGICLIAKTYSPLNNMAYFEPVDNRRSLQRTVIRQYSLSDILSQNPQFPQFWPSVAQEGIVSEIVFSQSAFDKTEGERIVTIGKEGDIAVPNALVELRDDSTVRIFFINPIGAVLLWPQCVASDTFTFAWIPAVIDRAFRVYCNACETRGKQLFFDVDATHVIYKQKSYKRLAIEYRLDKPTHMRPVMVEV